MQGNRGPRQEHHNHGPPRQQGNPQHEQQRKQSGGADNSNGQHTDAAEQASPSKAFFMFECCLNIQRSAKAILFNFNRKYGCKQ